MPPASLLVLAPLDPVVALALVEVEDALVHDVLFLSLLPSDLVDTLRLLSDHVELGCLLRSPFPILEIQAFKMFLNDCNRQMLSQ